MKNVRAIKLSLRSASRVFALGAMGALAMACSSSADATTGEADFTSESNTDVQVISAKTYGSIQWGDGGATLDGRKCVFYDKRPYDREGSTEFSAQAHADCTAALANAKGLPVNQYQEPLAWIHETMDVDHAVFRHWCAEAEVIVAVKAAAWDSPSFEGIGFYGFEMTLNNNPANRRVFYSKTDARMKRVGEGTLKNEGHQKVYLYRFAGAGPCEINGSGQNPRGRLEFKPYANYQGGHERWENVPANHSVGYQQSWDRRGDLLD